MEESHYRTHFHQMSALSQVQILKESLLQRVDSLAMPTVVHSDDASAVDSAMAEIVAIEDKFRNTLLPKLAKLVTKATQPSETRLLNAATCETILALRTWANEFGSDLDRSRIVLAGAVADREKQREDLRRQEQLLALLAQIEDEEQQDRKTCVCDAEVAARNGITTAAKRQRKKVVISGKRDQRRAEEAKEEIAARSFLSTFAEAQTPEEQLHEYMNCIVDDADDEADLLDSDEAAERRLLMQQFQDGMNKIISRGQKNADFLSIARVPLHSFDMMRCEPGRGAAVEWETLRAENAQCCFSCGPRSIRIWRCLCDCGIVTSNVLDCTTVSKSGVKRGGNSIHSSSGGAEGRVSLSAVHGTIAVILAHGGYFSGGVYDTAAQQFTVHKTFSRYIVRRGQGGRQSGHDGRTDTAGSQLRAREEAKWIAEVQETIRLWLPRLALCRLILYHSPGDRNTRMVRSAGLLGIDGPLVARVPFATGRPTFAEVGAIIQMLLSVTVAVSPPT